MLGFLTTITHAAQSAGSPLPAGGPTVEAIRSSSKAPPFQSFMRQEGEEGIRDDTAADLAVPATDLPVSGESPDDESDALSGAAGGEGEPDKADFELQVSESDLLLSDVKVHRNEENRGTVTPQEAEASSIGQSRLARNSVGDAVDLAGSLHSDVANREGAAGERDGFLTESLPHSGPLSGSPPYNPNETQEGDPTILSTKRAIDGHTTRAGVVQQDELPRGQIRRNSDTQDGKDKAEPRLVADMPVTIRTRQSHAEFALSQKLDLPGDQRLTGQIAAGESTLALDASTSLLEAREEASLRTDALGAVQAKAETKTAAFGTSSGAQAARHVAGQMYEAMTRSSDRSIDVFFSPSELGRVRLTLSPTELGMIVNVAAERTETLDLMRRHSDVLSQEFQSLGYGDTGFTFTREEQGQRGGQSDTLMQAAPEAEQSSVTSSPEKTGLTDRLDIRL